MAKTPKKDFETLIKIYKKKQSYVNIKEYLMIFLILSLYALCVNQILVPHTIVSGALTGICEIIYFATNGNIPIWLMTAVLNIGLLILAGCTVGWKFCYRTIVGVFSLTFWLKIIPIADVPIISDKFMATIVAGFIAGISLGTVFLNHGSSGGTDIIAAVVNKYKKLPMGQMLFFCDLIIISSAWFLPQITEIDQIFYGLCFTFVCGTSVDMLMNRSHSSIQFFIFTTKYKEVTDVILKTGRGATLLDARGGYTNKNVEVVTTVVKEIEANKLYNMIREVDPTAFISEVKAKGVYGVGFDK